MQDPLSSIQVVFIQGLLVFGLRHGIAPEALCRVAQVPLSELDDPEERAPYAWVESIWQALAGLLPHLELGMELGQFWTLDRLGYLGEVLRNSPTLLEVLRKATRAAQLLDYGARQTPIELHERADRVSVVIPTAITDGVAGRLEMIAVMCVAQLRQLSQVHILPTCVRFGFDKPQARARYEAYFGCPIELACEATVLSFEPATLALPVQGAQLGAQAHLEAFMDQAFARSADAELLANVRHAIAELLERGALSGDATARALGLSTRSLQRRLVNAGTSYRALADEGRREAALRLLRDAGSSTHAIAAALGYQDVGSFVQAFRRWTGKTPAEFRKHAEPGDQRT